MSEKKSILFVDDSIHILHALRRMLYPMEDMWHMTFVNSGQEALDSMRKDPYHVVISDMHMPGMDGGQLLNIVRKDNPHVVRIALTGAASNDAVIQSLGFCHRILSKPCRPQELKDCITSACSINDLMVNKKLQTLTSQLEALPSMPSLYAELMNVIQSEDTSIKDIADVVCKDVGMSVKILHLANSAYFGMRQHTSNVLQAITMLGIDTIKPLVLSAKIFAKYEEIEIADFTIKKLWDHSYTVGRCARMIAKKEEIPHKVLDVYMIAGMMHDIGILVIASTLPTDYRDVLLLNSEENIPIHEAEKQILNTTHAEVGAYLLGLWGFNNDIVDAVLYHHNPSEKIAQGITAQAAVYIANTIAVKFDAENNGFENDVEVNYGYLENIGLLDKMKEYENLCFPVSLC